MDDHRATGTPDPGRHPLAQERTDDEVGLVVGCGGAHRRRVAGELDMDPVAGATKLGPDPLGQAIEGRAEQHDLHG
jgi:hypothetical protein